MNKYHMHKAGIDVGDALRRFENDEDFYVHMLKEFAEQESIMASLRDGLSEQDANKAFQAAHAMKGTTGNLSMTTLYESLLPLVETLRADSLEGTEEKMQQVEANYALVLEAISEL